MTKSFTLPPSTLLLVDHRTNNLEALKAMFGHEYNIELAMDGKQAFTIACEKDIDLILCSVNCNIISGPELCTLIKNNPITHHIPVIVLTHQPSCEEEELCLEVGVIDYISYRVKPQILYTRVYNHMGLVEQQKVLEHVSSTDGLTGLANRLQLDTTLSRIWHTAIRTGSSIGLLMVDIDHFKLYNDEFGHIKGDECLKMVAAAIAKSKLRDEDFAARYGGEEFVLLLPFTELVGTKKVAKQLIKKIQGLNIPAASKATTKHVTVSVGVAAMSPKFDPIRNISPMKLIAQADKNLFKAKRAGRNQVI